MKKILLFSVASLILSIPQLYSISLREYIQQNGMPEVNSYDVLNLCHKELTSLEGLQDIPEQTLQQVKSLALDGNQLQTILPGTFRGLPNLKMLYLCGNRLTTLAADTFEGLNNLNELYLNNNQLTALSEDTFAGLDNLELLKLEDNQLKSLPKTIFNGLNKLRGLFLRRNPFTSDFLNTLPTIIEGIPQLEYLDNESPTEALKNDYLIYQPKSLLEIAKKYARENLSLEEMAKLPSDILDAMPLTSPQRAAITALKKQIK